MHISIVQYSSLAKEITKHVRFNYELYENSIFFNKIWFKCIISPVLYEFNRILTNIN